MNEIWRHFKFDFRRWWWWLAAGVLLAPPFAPYLACGLLALVVVPFVVMNHKTAGSGAWWPIRPFNRTRLALAKLLAIAFLCAGVFIVLSLQQFARGFHPWLVTSCKLEDIPPAAALCSLTAVLACLSKDLRRFYLLVGATLVATVILGTLWLLLVEYLTRQNTPPEVMLWFPNDFNIRGNASFLAASTVTICLLTVFARHYERPRPRWTIPAACISVLVPLYVITTFYQPGYHPLTKVETNPAPADWSIALTEKEIKAEKVVALSKKSGKSIPIRFQQWAAVVPLEIRFPTPLRPDESLEFATRFHFRVADDISVEGDTGGSWWWVHRKTAALHVAGLTTTDPVDDGGSATVRIPLVRDEWFNRPLEVRTGFHQRLWRFRSHLVGEIRLAQGSVLNDGANRFEFLELDAHRNWIRIAASALRPSTESNPAWPFILERADHTFFLWDDRNSVAHFPPSLSSWGDRGHDDGSIFLEFPDADLQQTGNLRIIVVRHSRIATHEAGFEPDTFVIRRPEGN